MSGDSLPESGVFLVEYHFDTVPLQTEGIKSTIVLQKYCIK